jgi:hypothetical protein
MYMMRVTGVSRKPDAGFPQVFEVASKPRNENRIKVCMSFLMVLR